MKATHKHEYTHIFYIIHWLRWHAQFRTSKPSSYSLKNGRNHWASGRFSETHARHRVRTTRTAVSWSSPHLRKNTERLHFKEEYWKDKKSNFRGNVQDLNLYIKTILKFETLEDTMQSCILHTHTPYRVCSLFFRGYSYKSMASSNCIFSVLYNTKTNF